MSILNRWTEYQPQKGTVIWGVIVGSVLTMAVGFMWGGWVTGGTASGLAQEAAKAARADVVAAVCVNNFMASSDPRAQQEELVALRSYQQRDFVEKAEWAKASDGLELSRDSASLCAERIAAIDADTLVGPLAKATESANTAPETIVQ